MNKFTIGDRVVVIKLDEGYVNEPYDGLGEQYKQLFHQEGFVIEDRSTSNFSRYTVSFEPHASTDAWYFFEEELMLAVEFEKCDKETLKLLYGRE